MKETGLISLLKTFSKNEIKEFDKFLRSPYFTEGKNIRHRILYDYFIILKEFYPSFSNKSYTKEHLYSKLYPETKYNDGIVRKLNSDLAKLAEQFLIQLELEKDKFKQKEYLLNNLSPRKMDKSFLKKAELAYRLLDENPFDLYYYFNKQLTNILVNNFSIYRQALLTRYDLQNEANNFFLYFLSRSLEIFRNMTIDEGMLNVKYRPFFMNEVLIYLKQNQGLLDEQPLLAIHYYELMVNISDDVSNFKKLKDLKNLYIDRLDTFGKYNICVNLSSFCFKMIRGGSKAYRKELLNIDLEFLEKGIYRISDYVSYTYLISTVRNAAKINDFKNAEKFITAYSDMLDPIHRDFAVNYARAEIFYEQKKYSEALECLSKITIEYSREKQQIRNTITKIYYETGSFENALSIIDSSRHFLLKEKQIPAPRKISASYFLKFSSHLINLRLNPDESKINRLKHEIIKTGFFANKDWLLEKIDELTFKV